MTSLSGVAFSLTRPDEDKQSPNANNVCTIMSDGNDGDDGNDCDDGDGGNDDDDNNLYHQMKTNSPPMPTIVYHASTMIMMMMMMMMKMIVMTMMMIVSLFQSDNRLYFNPKRSILSFSGEVAFSECPNFLPNSHFQVLHLPTIKKNSEQNTKLPLLDVPIFSLTHILKNSTFPIAHKRKVYTKSLNLSCAQI